MPNAMPFPIFPPKFVVMGSPSLPKRAVFQKAALTIRELLKKDNTAGNTLLWNQEGDSTAIVDPSRNLDQTLRGKKRMFSFMSQSMSI